MALRNHILLPAEVDEDDEQEAELAEMGREYRGNPPVLTEEDYKAIYGT